MTIDDKIRDEKLQYDINREAEKMSGLLLGKIDKYEYLTGEEILPPDQSRVIEQTKSTYSRLGKALEKKTTKKEVDAFKYLNLPNESKWEQIESKFPKKQLNNLIIWLKVIMQLRENIKSDALQYTTKRWKRYKITRYSWPIVFLRDIHKESLPLKDTDEDQIQLSDELKDMGKAEIPVEKRFF